MTFGPSILKACKKRRQTGNAARFGVLLLICWVSTASCWADQEHQVKAAFIANFIKFIDWPDLGKPGSKFVIGVYGADAYEHTIEDTLNGRSLSGHPIVVQQIHSDAEVKQCRLVVSGASSEDRIDKLTKICTESGVVLVGESDGFAKMGGTIGFLLVSARVRFEINLETAKKTRVSVSSKLLSLAHSVYR